MVHYQAHEKADWQDHVLVNFCTANKTSTLITRAGHKWEDPFFSAGDLAELVWNMLKRFGGP